MRNCTVQVSKVKVREVKGLSNVMEFMHGRPEMNSVWLHTWPWYKDQGVILPVSNNSRYFRTI